MAISIDRFRMVNKERGKALVLASFTALIGPIEINGIEIIKGSKGTFISFPNRSYNAGTQQRPDWKTFNFIWFSGSKGEALKKEIEQAAMEELDRRGGEADEGRGRGGGRGGSNGYGGGGNRGGNKSYRSRASYDDEDDDSMPF